MECSDVQYVKIAHDLFLSDIQIYPNKINWASQLRNLLGQLGFYMYEVWLA